MIPRLVSLLNFAVVISVGSLAATLWQQNWALCKTSLCPMRAFCRTPLQDSSAPFWSNLEIQTRDFLQHLGWISGLILEALWSTQSLMLVVQEMKGGDGCAPSLSTRNHLWVPFLYPFHPQNFMVTSFSSRLLRSLGDICSRVTVIAVLQQVSDFFFSPSWTFLFMLIYFPGCCTPNV